MPQVKSETLPIANEPDLVLVRRAVRQVADELGLNILNGTKIVTAASELARNALIHGGGGSVCIETCLRGGRWGLRLTFEDKGPGIPDLELAMTDGFTTAHGLGLGLGGSRRLVDDFEIDTHVNEGTRVTVTQWT